MPAISDYLIKIICAALICGILKQVIRGNNAVSAIVNTIMGVFLAVTIFSPLINIKLDHKLYSIDEFLRDGAYFSALGESVATNQQAELIKSSTQTYILDKAVSMGVELEVEVVLSDHKDEIYKSVSLRGDVSPYAKDQLSRMIAKDLGIPEEAQRWIN